MPTPLEYFSAIGTPLVNAGLGIGTDVTQIALNNSNRRWQERMVRQQNTYNSPAAQRARAIRAGIAPNYAPQGAAGFEAVTSPNLTSPSVSGLSDAPAKLQQSDLNRELIQQSRSETYRAGVEASVALQEKMIKIANDLAELESKGVHTQEARQRIKNLQMEYDQMHDTFQAYVDTANANADFAKSRANEQEEFTKREHERLLSDIKHAREMEKISMYNALTERMNASTYSKAVASQSLVNESVRKLNDQERQRVIHLTTQEAYNAAIAKLTVTDDVAIKKLQRQLSQYDVNERMAAAAMAAIDLGWKQDKDASELGYIFRRVFGLDIEQAATVGAMVGLGASALGRLRGSAAKVPKSEVAPFHAPEKGISRSQAEKELGRPLSTLRGITGD